MFRLQALFLASFFLSLCPLRMCLSWRTWLLWSCLTGMCLLTSRSFFQFSPIVHLAQQIQPEAGGEVICSWFCCSFTSLVMVPVFILYLFPLSFAEKITSLKSVQFSAVSVVSDSLQPHELQHARPPCPYLTPGVPSNSCPLSWWCHPTISSSVVPFFPCLQSFPASGSFPVSQFFVSDGQNVGASASASVLPMNILDWFPLGLTGLIFLLSKGPSGLFSNTTIQKLNSLVLSFLYGLIPTSIHDYWKIKML